MLCCAVRHAELCAHRKTLSWSFKSCSLPPLPLLRSHRALVYSELLLALVATLVALKFARRRRSALVAHGARPKAE